jgi:CO/xanthine dehydrogenase Mo-binding subunit
MGKVLRDMPVLCWDRVRYIGDRVAAVAAATPEAAEEALLRIDVDYEVLPLGKGEPIIRKPLILPVLLYPV